MLVTSSLMSSDMYNEIRQLYITAAQRAPEKDIDCNVQVKNCNSKFKFWYCRVVAESDKEATHLSTWNLLVWFLHYLSESRYIEKNLLNTFLNISSLAVFLLSFSWGRGENISWERLLIHNNELSCFKSLNLKKQHCQPVLNVTLPLPHRSALVSCLTYQASTTKQWIVFRLRFK